MLNSVANYKNVDGIVKRLQEAGVNVRWNGWSLSFLKPDPAAARSPYGAYQNGVWGFVSIVEPNSKGKWNLGRWAEGVYAR